MGSLSTNGAYTALPDPDYQPYPIPERGGFLNGKPVRQGYESGMLKWPGGIPSAGMNELRARYEANKNAQVSGALPRVSGYGWGAVSAYWHEPVPTGWDGPIAHGVTQVVSRIVRY